MKIIYLHQYFSNLNGNVGTRSFEMGRRLVKMGHEVHMITSYTDKTDDYEWFETVEEGINVHWYPVEYRNSYGFTARILAFFKFSLAALIKGRTLSGDVVFATSTPLTIIIPGFFIARKLSIPLVFEVRDLWPELPIAIGVLKNPLSKFMARMLEKFAYRNSNKIVALSDGMRDGVLKLDYPEKDISVIPNSCDLNFFKIDDEVKVRNDFREQHGIPLDAKVILYAGTFGRINGVGYMVELASQLAEHTNIFFFAVGHGAEFSNVSMLATKAGVLGNNFILKESLRKSEMPNLFCSADVILSLFIPLVEMEANSANKFFDGLSAGRCVLINYGGWQEALLQESQAGFRLSRKADVAADQIQKLFDSPELIESCGRNARAAGEKFFSRDKLAKKLERVLSSAIDGSPC
jgi:glycosyltransferase involved in cell wall biosynthesis